MIMSSLFACAWSSDAKGSVTSLSICHRTASRYISVLIKLLLVCMRGCVCHTFQYILTNFESSDILYVLSMQMLLKSYSACELHLYTNGPTLPVSQLEQGHFLAMPCS